MSEKAFTLTKEDYEYFESEGFNVVKGKNGRYYVKPTFQSANITDYTDAIEKAKKCGFAFDINSQIIGYKKPELKTSPIQIKEEGALRFDLNKVRHDLLPAWAINELAKVYTMGAKKYADHNWRKGMSWSRVIGSLKRHLNAIESGEDFDSESGLYHASHVAWNAITLLEYYKIYPQGDDRQHPYLSESKIGLDIDEVLCDFTKGWAKLYDTEHRPTSWYYDREMGTRFKEMKENGTLDDFYLQLESKINPNDIPFEPCCYVTSRPVSTEITKLWLDKYGFPQVPVITVGVGESKVEALKKAGVTIFVDDRYENFVDLNKAGICTYLYDAPHNQRYDVGYKRIKSLKELKSL